MPEEGTEQGTVRYFRCPSCGMPHPITASVCSRCGKPLKAEAGEPHPPSPRKPAARESETVCARCGKSIPAGSKFCGYCGAPLPTPPPTAPTAELPAVTSPVKPAAPPAAPRRPPVAHKPSPPQAAPPAPAPAPPASKLAPPAPAPPPAAPTPPAEAAQGTRVFPGLRVPRIAAQIIEVKADDSPGKTLRIVKETIIGRGTCDASYPEDALLSLRHAAIHKGEGKIYLKDLESQNGTFIKQRQDTELIPGDVFVIGRALFRIAVERMDESPASAQGTLVMAGAPKLQPGPITAKLEHIQLSGEVIETFSLDKPQTTIGRTTGDLVFAHDPYMSGTHARIVAQPGRFILQDLKSRNGIYRRIHGEVSLQDGDEFFLGEHRFRVEIKTLED